MINWSKAFVLTKILLCCTVLARKPEYLETNEDVSLEFQSTLCLLRLETFNQATLTLSSSCGMAGSLTRWFWRIRLSDRQQNNSMFFNLFKMPPSLMNCLLNGLATHASVINSISTIMTHYCLTNIIILLLIQTTVINRGGWAIIAEAANRSMWRGGATYLDLTQVGSHSTSSHIPYRSIVVYGSLVWRRWGRKTPWEWCCKWWWLLVHRHLFRYRRSCCPWLRRSWWNDTDSLIWRHPGCINSRSLMRRRQSGFRWLRWWWQSLIMWGDARQISVCSFEGLGWSERGLLFFSWNLRNVACLTDLLLCRFNAWWRGSDATGNRRCCTMIFPTTQCTSGWYTALWTWSRFQLFPKTWQIIQNIFKAALD